MEDKRTTETRNPRRISEKSSKNLRELGGSVVNRRETAKVLCMKGNQVVGKLVNWSFVSASKWSTDSAENILSQSR